MKAVDRRVKHQILNKKFNKLFVIEKLDNGSYRCICDCGNEKLIKTAYDLVHGKVQQCKECSIKNRFGENNYNYGKKCPDPNKFRKYPNNPLINYDDFVETKYGTKRYMQFCYECSEPKGYRALDSVGLPCFTCAMKKNRKYTEIQRRIREAAKARMSSKLRRKRLGKPINIHFRDFPFTLDELMNHLQSLFEPDMSWNNYGEWQVDHIRPESSFNYSSCKDPEFLACWSLDNLQPMWAIENQKKGAKYEQTS